jgi:CRISPR-associated exonuclease Cas4
MFTDDQLLPISALQHLIFCERQCALIHVERLWAENQFTVEGRHLHDKAHDGKSETAAGVRIARGLWLKSNRLGITGQADVVEFHRDKLIVPVEYKRGKPKKDDSDRVQLCAQALCLEEMTSTQIESGHLFYGTRKRRTVVTLDDALRDVTKAKIDQFRHMVENHITPTAQRQPKCDKCSLLDLCMPGALRFGQGAKAWNDRQFEAISETESPKTDPFQTVGDP